MSIVQFDSQKIEKLLKAATSERQRKMYQALLNKARSQERSSTDSSASRTNPSTEKKVPNGSQTLTKEKNETKKKTQTVKKNQKANPISATTEASTSKKQSKKTVTESSKLTPDSSPQTPSRQGLENEGKDFGQNSTVQDYKPNPSEKKEDRLPTSPKTSQPEQRAIEVAPQTELKSQSQKPKKQQPDTAPPIFQALGAVIATPSLQDELLKVAINGGEYDLLYVPGSRHQAYNLLRSELEKNGSEPMFLRLYPNAKFNRKFQQSRLSFSLVYFSRDCEKINDEPVGFVLRGIWQYIPHCKSPVISIYRNHCPPQLEFFKKLNTNQQLYFAQPRHIPVVWDTTIEPFKFNPQAKKGSQMPRYFVDVRASFKDGVYVVEEMLSEPTLKIPKFIKVSRKKQPKSVKKAATKSDS